MAFASGMICVSLALFFLRPLKVCPNIRTCRGAILFLGGLEVGIDSALSDTESLSLHDDQPLGAQGVGLGELDLGHTALAAGIRAALLGQHNACGLPLSDVLQCHLGQAEEQAGN